MTPLRRRLLLNLAKLFDLEVTTCCFVLALLFAAVEAPTVSIAQFLAMRIKVQNFVLFAGFLFAWHVVFLAFGLYQSRRLATRSAEALDVLKATTTASVGLFLAATVFHIYLITPRFVVVFWSSTSMVLTISRAVGRYMLRKLRRRGRNLRQVLVVGTNPRALRLARRLESHLELGYRIAGFVDDPWQGLPEFRESGYPLVSNLEGLPSYIREHVADEVVVALPMESCYARASQIAAWCEEQGITVRLLSDIFGRRHTRSRAEDFEDDTVITLYSSAPESWQHLCKRALDILVATVCLVGLLPLFLLAAVLVKLTSDGPTFFVQDRVGFNKRRFRLYKFRTMVVDAEDQFYRIQHLNEAGGPVFKIWNDPRITPVGKFLRKLSIDELPQLLNVLKGDMSLVGPRPLPWRDYSGFYEDWQRRRFSVRPGITCLWQVNGRSSIPFEKWMELDMQYIDQWSLWLDFKILAKTVPAVLKGTGAA